MVRRWLWVLGLLVLGVASGWTQTYGPGEIYYGGIRLQFSGRLSTAGTCMPATQPAPGVTEIRCQVLEGSAGTVELTGTRTPAGAVNMRVESVPAGWPGSLWTQQLGQWMDSRNSVASAWGTVTAQYRFTVPAGTTGRQFTLRFKAWTVGVVGELELRVIVEVVRPPTTPTPTEPTVPPSHGPFTGTTDGAGRFDVPIPTLPNTTVTGQLTECTVRALPRTQVAVTLVPKPGVVTISRADQIGAVRVSSPGYAETEIVQLMLASSIDLFGRVWTTVGVGTACLRPTAPVTPPPVTPTGPITGKSDAEGKFTGTLAPGVTVTGRLTECTVKPLPNQQFTLTPLPKGEVIASPEDIAGFTFAVPGYQETTVTKFSKFSLFGLTTYSLGDVCLPLAAKPDLRLENICLEAFDEVYRRRFGELDERLHPESPKPSPLPTRYLVGVQLEVVNDGDALVRELPVVELVVLDSGGREVSRKALTVTAVKADMPQRWRAEGVILIDLKGAMPTSLPTFRLIVDPGNKIAEKDETNNEAERGCDPAYRQIQDPKIHDEGGVLKKNEDGSWVVGKNRELKVRGEAFLGQAVPPPSGTGLPESWRTEVPCYPKCPLAIQYEWDFGDGTPKKTGRSVSHTYTRNGRYTITLTTILGDDRRTATQVIEVTDKPIVTAKSQYERVFVQRVSVPNIFTAFVDPNGNTLERVEWLLNGRLVQTTAYNTRDPIQDSWTYDLGRLQAHPLENQIVVRAIARAGDGRAAVGEASLSVLVAAVPSWLEWTLTMLPGPGQVPLHAKPGDGWVLYETSYAFPYPPIDINYKIPEGVPVFGGEYKFGAEADFSLVLNSLPGTGNVGGRGGVRFEKGGGEWTFGFEGEVTGKATLTNTPPISLAAGEFSVSLEGSFTKDLTVSDVPVIGPKVRAAKAIPLIGSAIKWLENRAKAQFGFSVGLGGDVSFTSGEPGRCLAGIDCSGKASLSGGLKLALEVDLEVLKVTPYGGAKLTVSFTAPGETIGFLDFGSLTLTGTIGISVVVDLWICEVGKDFAVDFSWRILSPGQGFVADVETPWTFPVRPYDTPAYSTFRGEARAVPELGVTELWLVEEVFPHARPTLVRDPGFTLVTWTTDDLAKPFPLGREITYSSGASMTALGRPRLITDNELPDSQAALSLDWTGNPVAVWVQHVSPPPAPTTEQDLTPELLAGLEIVYARYDRGTASWTAPLRLTDNDFPDHSPRFLHGPWGITGIIWTANAYGEIFPHVNAPDTLFLARWDGQAFSAPRMLREGDISHMRAFADLGGRILYVWVEDMDGDWGTRGDEELLWSVWDGASWTPPERLTTNSVDDEWPVLFPTGIGRADLLWVRIEPGAEGSEGVLLVRSFGPDGWTDERVLFEGRPIFSFSAARSRDGQVAVVWQELSAQGPDLFAVACNPATGHCTDPRQLTADPHQEGQLAVVFDGRVLTVAFVRTVVEDQTRIVRYTGPDLEDPTVYHQDEEFEITAPMPGPAHLYLLEVALP